LLRDCGELPLQDEAVLGGPKVEEIATTELEAELLAQLRSGNAEPVHLEIHPLQDENSRKDAGDVGWFDFEPLGRGAGAPESVPVMKGGQARVILRPARLKGGRFTPLPSCSTVKSSHHLLPILQAPDVEAAFGPWCPRDWKGEQNLCQQFLSAALVS